MVPVDYAMPLFILNFDIRFPWTNIEMKIDTTQYLINSPTFYESLGFQAYTLEIPMRLSHRPSYSLL